MAEVSFARKYRPKSFSEYMGGEIRKTLEVRMSDERNYPQVVLLFGERGCGKTTAARLLAKEFQCLEKVDGHACGVCEMCQEIDEKLINSEAGEEVVGVQELDIASDSGKAAIDEALDSALEEPMYPLKYKILILDECHMATPTAQNRLLKITEEPPKHLIMIFCTTDPQKMIKTLLDRCTLKLKVKKANEDEMLQRLLKGCESEGIKTSKEALRLIIRKCDRNPRQCWNKLEEIAKSNNYEVLMSGVERAFDQVGGEIYLEYFDSANKGLPDIMRFLKKLQDMDMDYHEFIRGLTRFILDCIYIKEGIGLDMHGKEFLTAVKKFFKEYTSGDFDMLLQIVEYASQYEIKSDKSRESYELIITTSALRIGKTQLLSIGLQNESEKAFAETRAGNAEGIKKLKESQSNIKVIKEKVNEGVLTSVFGRNITEVAPGAKIDIISSDNDEDDVPDKRMSDEDLLKFFN